MSEHLVFEPSETTHWKNLFPSKMMLLGSQNLLEGEELIATIKSVSMQTIKSNSGKDDVVPVVVFETAPPMVLNITNSRTIASLYGEDYDKWAGRSIQIYVTDVKSFGGGQQKGLRIRQAIPVTNESVSDHEEALRACTTMKDLQAVFTAIPKHIKPLVTAIKDEIKASINANN